jgi:hypothetical protein
MERPTFLILNPAREKGLEAVLGDQRTFFQARKLVSYEKPGGKTTMDVYQWLSVPGAAEQWAIQTGLEHPLIASSYSQATDTIGIADFISLSDTNTSSDFTPLHDADTPADFIPIPDTKADMVLFDDETFKNTSTQIPTDWALTLFYPGRWYIFRVMSNAPPARPASSTLGEAIQLHGVDLDKQSYIPGETVHLILHWQSLQHPTEDYTVFAQLIDMAGQLQAQQDAKPIRPTSSWLLGQRFADGYEIPLDEEMLAGDYRLIVGMYNPSTGQRLPAYQDDGTRWPDDAVVLTTLVMQNK